MTTAIIHPTAPKPIPVMPGLPLVGNLFGFMRDALGFVQRAMQAYATLVELRIMNQPVYLINDPYLIEEIMIPHNQRFTKNREITDFCRLVFGRGLLVSDGDLWRRQRRLAQPAFHRQRINAYGESIAGLTEQLLQSWPEGETRDIHDAMMQLTLKTVAKTLFSQEETTEINRIRQSLDAILARFDVRNFFTVLDAVLHTELPTPLNRRYHKAVRQLDAIVNTVIAERRRAWQQTGEDKGDLMGMFLAACDETGGGMSDQQLLDECKTMFLAGHETTALGLTWTFWLLDQHPECRARLQAELRQVLAGRTPTVADLPNLRYTEQVVLESMRLMPPVWSLQRETTVAIEVDGYHFPQGSHILFSQYAMHRDPRWYVDPDRFDPDRWANDLLKQNPKFAYFPFGGGPHLCIGQQFAMMQTILVLAQITQHFDLTVAPGQRIEPQASVTLHPRYGLKMTLRRNGVLHD